MEYINIWSCLPNGWAITEYKLMCFIDFQLKSCKSIQLCILINCKISNFVKLNCAYSHCLYFKNVFIICRTL